MCVCVCVCFSLRPGCCGGVDKYACTLKREHVRESESQIDFARIVSYETRLASCARPDTSAGRHKRADIARIFAYVLPAGCRIVCESETDDRHDDDSSAVGAVSAHFSACEHWSGLVWRAYFVG